MGSLPFAFASPAMLFGLAALVAIWFLLRLVPPRPRAVLFPPARLLLDGPNQEETPARTPWWLTLLRLLLAALVILALAGPIFRPLDRGTVSDGLLALVVDNGWGAADQWSERIATAESLIDQAESNDRAVAIVATADGAAQSFAPTNAADARDRLRALEPRPWPADRGALSPGLTPLAAEASEIVWLGDAIAGPSDDGFLNTLSGMPDAGNLVYFEPGAQDGRALVSTVNDADKLTVTIGRAGTGPTETGLLIAYDDKSRPIGRADFTFDPEASEAEASFDLPIELRNQIARLEISGKQNAGGIFFLDERWRRRTVGLLAGSTFDFAQPLLSPLHYLSQALVPFADVRTPKSQELGAATKELIDQNVSVIVLADIGTLVGEGADRLGKWVEDGGMLVRFAGPRLAEGATGLLPVRLRNGERTLGGNLSWEEPQPIGQFSAGTPFAGISVGKDVTVTRQVLAEPDADLPDKTWASLADGTPLVTADQSGRGWIVLFHVTADTTWSNLPLSGTFVEMLRKIISFSNARTRTVSDGNDQQQASLPPLKILNGFGEIGAPTRDAKALIENQLPDLTASADHPPGLYGSQEGFRALNLFHDGARPAAFDKAVLDQGSLSGRFDVRTYATTEPVNLKKWLFLAALFLLLADTIIMTFIRGLPRLGLPQTSAIAGALLAGGLLTLGDASAQQNIVTDTESIDQITLESTLQTRLAYVMTGNAENDEKARNGLFGLSVYLAERTALEPGSPVGVNLDEDELAFFPILYWPVTADAEPPSEQGLARVDSFMKNGGTVIFDTADQLSGGQFGTGTTTPESARLREILLQLDVPPLEPVPSDHVLTKAFYLLQDFPGRWSGGPLWVERLQASERGDRPVRASDGVTPIMITGNDLAGAWAVSEDGNPIYPTVPDSVRQRELAYRVGVNIVIYTLTGNYKADQVHVPALLERLGQ